MGAMISKNSHSSHSNLNFMFTEDKPKMTTSTIRKIIISQFLHQFSLYPSVTASGAGCM